MSMGFPKWVFKRGTGKKMENERFEAESVLVASEGELADLGSGWCDSPAEAAAPAEKAESKFELKLEPKSEEKTAKKVK